MVFSVLSKAPGRRQAFDEHFLHTLAVQQRIRGKHMSAIVGYRDHQGPKKGNGMAKRKLNRCGMSSART